MIRLFARCAVLVLAIAGVADADPLDPDERDCPTDVRGVRIASSALRDGVAFTFTVAKPTQLAGLRTVLRDAASIVERRSRLAALHPEVMPTSDGAGDVPALAISVRNTPSGAIVSVRPEEPRQIALVQHNARSFELFWSQHACVDTPKLAVPAVISPARATRVAWSPRRAARSTGAIAEARVRVP